MTEAATVVTEAVAELAKPEVTTDATTEVAISQVAAAEVAAASLALPMGAVADCGAVSPVELLSPGVCDGLERASDARLLRMYCSDGCRRDGIPISWKVS